MENFQQEEKSSYNCEYCNKVCNSKSKFARHLLVHTKEKQHVCNYCNKQFSLNYNLKTHLRVHTGEKPFVCRISGCCKQFSQLSNRNVHERFHSRKTQYTSCSKLKDLQFKNTITDKCEDQKITESTSTSSKATSSDFNIEIKKESDDSLENIETYTSNSENNFDFAQLDF